MAAHRWLFPLTVCVAITTSCAEEPPVSPTASDPTVRDCAGDWAALLDFTDPLEVTGLARAPNGDLVLTGTFEGTVDFGGVAVTSAGMTDAFILRLDSCGYPLAADSRGDAELSELIEHLHIDDQGNLFFLESVSDSSAVTPVGQRLVSLDAAGDERWQVDLTSLNQARVYDLAVAPDGTSVTLGNSEFLESPTMIRFDAQGQVVHEKVLPATSLFWESVAVSKDGGVTLVGSAGAIEVSLGKVVLPPAGPLDAVLFQLDASGNAQWGKRWGAPDRTVGAHQVALDDKGHVVIAGQFGGGSLNLGFGDLNQAGVGAGSYIMLLQADGEYVTSINGPAYRIEALRPFVGGWLAHVTMGSILENDQQGSALVMLKPDLAELRSVRVSAAAVPFAGDPEGGVVLAEKIHNEHWFDAIELPRIDHEVLMLARLGPQ